MKLKFGKEAGLFTLLVVICLATGLKQPLFFSPANVQNTARIIGMYGVFSLGMALVIITGGIDLSVGSIFALLGVLLSLLLVNAHISPVGACVMIIGSGAFLGLIHAFLITKVKLQPFIVTLCGLLFYRGLARFIVNDNTVGFGDMQGNEWLKNMTSGNQFGVPIPFIVLIGVASVMFVALHRTVWGRYLLAVGRNEEAARYAGVRSTLVVGSAYVICSLLAGVSTIQIAFYTNSISASSHGNFYELYAIAAAVLGGCSLRGGEGSVIGVLLGTALLQILRNLVNLVGIPSSLDFAVMGAVILIGVLIDQLLRTRKAKAKPFAVASG